MGGLSRRSARRVRGQVAFVPPSAKQGTAGDTGLDYPPKESAEWRSRSAISRPAMG